MEKIRKNIRAKFYLALSSSIMFVIGIPLIPIFAGDNWFLMILGIVLVVYGFYGTPLYWVSYAMSIRTKNVIEAIIYDHILTVSDLSNHLQLNEQDIINQINKIIKNRYIIGYLFDGVKLSLNENEKPQKKIKNVICVGCGASLTIRDDSILCPYCGKNVLGNM